MTSFVHAVRRSRRFAHLAAAALLVGFCSVAASAQAVNRAQLLQEIISLKAQLNSTTDPAQVKLLTDQLVQKERLFLAPSEQDQAVFFPLLNQPHTGVFRLMPRESFDRVLLTRGGGAYYSFASQQHEYGYGSDLSLEQNLLSIGFAGGDFGFMVSLGNVPIETVTAETPAVAWLAAFAPALEETAARQQKQQSREGIQSNGFSYINRLPLTIGVTYALRSIVYSGSDLLTVVRTLRRDTDGSVILLWKVLKRYATPELNGGTIATVSAASYAHSNFARETAAAAFGKEFVGGTYYAEIIPLPLQLGGAYVSVQDSSGRVRYAPLFAATPEQINYLIPPETAEGYALVSIRTASGKGYRELVRITKTAPGLFTANADGQGVPAAVALRVSGSQQTYEPIARFDAAQNKFVATPIDLGTAADQIFLLLFGTGLRERSSLANVSVKISGVDAPVGYAGEQGSAGLDQINVAIPRSLAGRGEVDVVLTVDGQTANTVRINIK